MVCLSVLESLYSIPVKDEGKDIVNYKKKKYQYTKFYKISTKTTEIVHITIL